MSIVDFNHLKIGKYEIIQSYIYGTCHICYILDGGLFA